MKFTDRMPDSREYADPTEIDINSAGWCIDYISSTFLNGWVNYVKPVKAFVVHRYEEDVEQLSKRVDAWHENPTYHTRLSVFEDDVMLLARSERGDWWYFWFDCDVSDCCIGKFEDEPGADIPAEFEEYVRERAEDLRSYHAGPAAWMELDVSKINGWVSF